MTLKIELSCVACKAPFEHRDLKAKATTKGQCQACQGGQWDLCLSQGSGTHIDEGSTALGVLSAAATRAGLTATAKEGASRHFRGLSAAFIEELLALDDASSLAHIAGYVNSHMAEENKHRRAFIEEEVAERRARSEARRAEHHARAEKEGKPCQQCHHPFLPPEIGPPLLWNIKGFCSSGCFHAWELQQHGQDCKICGKRFLMHKLGGPPPWERAGCCSLKCHQVVKSSSGETRAHRPKAQGPARVPGRFYALVAAMALMLLGSLIALSWIWIVVPTQEHAVRVETDFKDAQALIDKTRAALEKGKLEDTRAWLETAFRVLPDDERIQGKTFGQWKAEWRAALGAIVSLKLMDFDKFVRTRVYDVEYVTSLVNALGSDADKIKWKSLREGPSGSE